MQKEIKTRDESINMVITIGDFIVDFVTIIVLIQYISTYLWIEHMKVMKQEILQKTRLYYSCFSKKNINSHVDMMILSVFLFFILI